MKQTLILFEWYKVCNIRVSNTSENVSKTHRLTFLANNLMMSTDKFDVPKDIYLCLKYLKNTD